MALVQSVVEPTQLGLPVGSSRRRRVPVLRKRFSFPVVKEEEGSLASMPIFESQPSHHATE